MVEIAFRSYSVILGTAGSSLITPLLWLMVQQHCPSYVKTCKASHKQSVGSIGARCCPPQTSERVVAFAYNAPTPTSNTCSNGSRPVANRYRFCGGSDALQYVKISRCGGFQ